MLSPSEITLAGAANYIQKVGTVFVNVDVTGLTDNYNKNLQVEVLDTNGNNITSYFTISPSVASVIIPVVYDMPEKSVAINPAVIGVPATGYEISRIVVEPSTVRAFGDLEVLNTLYYLETEPIDVSGLRNTHTQTVDIIHGNNITLSESTVKMCIRDSY